MSRFTVAAIALSALLPANGWASNITVKPGDTLSKISIDHQIPIEQIMRLNGLKNSNQIKAGSLTRSERVAKYNQLIRIEEKLGKTAKMNKIN